MYLSLFIPIPNLLQNYNIFGIQPNAILLYGGNLLFQAMTMNELMDISLEIYKSGCFILVRTFSFSPKGF